MDSMDVYIYITIIKSSYESYTKNKQQLSVYHLCLGCSPGPGAAATDCPGHEGPAYPRASWHCTHVPNTKHTQQTKYIKVHIEMNNWIDHEVQ